MVCARWQHNFWPSIQDVYSVLTLRISKWGANTPQRYISLCGIRLRSVREVSSQLTLAFGDKRDLQILTFGPCYPSEKCMYWGWGASAPHLKRGRFQFIFKTYIVIVSIIMNMMSNLIFLSSVNTKMALSNAWPSPLTLKFKVTSFQMISYNVLVPLGCKCTLLTMWFRMCLSHFLVS